MAEISFPVVNKPLSEDQWKTIALGFAQGIVDRGGWPYLLTVRDNVTNEIEIGVDQSTGKNEAILGGFVHRIDHAKRLPVPAVTSTTTYEVGLVYDPLNHGTEAGPIKLDVWTAPGDYSQGKLRLVLYRITRAPNQTLTSATVQEWRQRISPQISVSNQADLPLAETVLVDTIALVRNGNKWMRSHKDAGTGVVSWTEVSASVESRSIAPTANTIPLRDSSGRLRSAAPSHADDVVPRQWFLDQTELLRTATGGNDQYGTLVKRSGTDGGFLVVNPVNAAHPTTKSYVDGKNWDGSRITSGTVPYDRIGGSSWAYDRLQSGTVYTVSVNSAGQFMRFSSTKRHKTNIRDWTKDPRALLALVPSIYDRIDPESGVVTNPNEVGVVAEFGLEAGISEFVQWGPDSHAVQVGPESEPLVQGWDYQRWGAAHQLLHRWQTERVDRIEHNQRVIATKLGLSFDESGYLIGE